MPFGSDGDYSDGAMVACANGFLANAYGNLQMRVVSLVSKNCQGVIPHPGGDWGDGDGDSSVDGAGDSGTGSTSGPTSGGRPRRGDPATVTAADAALLGEARGLAAAMGPHMDSLALHKACACLDAVVRHANR